MASSLQLWYQGSLNSERASLDVEQIQHYKDAQAADNEVKDENHPLPHL